MSAHPRSNNTWGRVKSSLKRKSSGLSTDNTKSVIFPKYNKSCEVSQGDQHGPTYGALQALSVLLLEVSQSFAKDERFSKALPPLEAFVDQVAEMIKSGKDPTTNTDVPHSVIVILYDDARLLSKEVALVGINGRKRDRHLEEKEDDELKNVPQKIEALRKRFEEWSQPDSPPAVTETKYRSGIAHSFYTMVREFLTLGGQGPVLLPGATNSGKS